MLKKSKALNKIYKMKKIIVGLLFVFSALSLQGQSWFSGTYAGKNVTINTGNGRYVYSTPTGGSIFVSDFISAQPFDQSIATFAAATCGDYISVVSAKRQLTLKAGQTFLVHRLFVSKLFPLNGGDKTLLFSLDPSISFEITMEYDDATAIFAQCGSGESSYIDSTWQTKGLSYIRTNNLDSAIYRHGGVFIQARDNIPGTSFQRDTVFMATADRNEGIGMYLSDISGTKDGQYIYMGIQNTVLDSLTTTLYHDSLGVFKLSQNALQEGSRSIQFDSTGTRISAGRDDKIKFFTNTSYDALTLSDSTTSNIINYGADTLILAYAPGANEARWLNKTQFEAYLDGFYSTAATSREQQVDEITATVGQTAFTLSATPATGDIAMYRNGILLTTACYSNVGTALTYVPGSNGGQAMVDADRINFIYLK